MNDIVDKLSEGIHYEIIPSSLDEKGWDGLLVEPGWAFHDLVPKNRPNALFDKRALVGSEEEGKMVKFVESEHHTLSHVVQGEESASYEVEGATLRTILDDNVQVFYVNGTKGSYTQNNDLKSEFSLSAGLNYAYNFSQNRKFLMALDGLYTSQDTSGIKANLKYSHRF